MTPHHIYVGCIGEGVFRSLDHGATFKRACDGMPFVECDVRALLIDPADPRRLYVGNEEGVFVSRDGADSWQQFVPAVGGLRVWSVLVRGQRLLAGGSPASIYRSDDGGASWKQGRADLRPDCPRIRHNRVTCLVQDPDNADRLWAGVEIDGLHESTDGGASWGPVGEGLTSRDIHGLVAIPGTRRLLATTNSDLNVSDDGGRTWSAANIDRVVPWKYTRAIAQKAGSPEVLFLGTGDGPPGSVGAIAVSRDAGRTWQPARMPGHANSTVWNFAVHAADPDLVYASSVSGQVYRSLDGGAAWQKLDREFGEVRGLAWAPC
jgi:photosystem II stability/assembly factor-like uncharacterized protein